MLKWLAKAIVEKAITMVMVVLAIVLLVLIWRYSYVLPTWRSIWMFPGRHSAVGRGRVGPAVADVLPRADRPEGREQRTRDRPACVMGGGGRGPGVVAGDGLAGGRPVVGRHFGPVPGWLVQSDRCQPDRRSLAASIGDRIGARLGDWSAGGSHGTADWTDIELLNSLRRLSQPADAFAAGVRRKLEEHAGRIFVGTAGPVIAADREAEFKDALANAGVLVADLLARTPANPTLRCDISPGWPARIWHRRVRLLAIVAVDVAEVIRRIAGQCDPTADWPTMSAAGLDLAMSDLRSPPARTFVGVCSPSGFGVEAMDLARQRAVSLARRGGRTGAGLASRGRRLGPALARIGGCECRPERPGPAVALHF